MLYLLLKTLHLIAMVTWFAGLFYLPRLFVYHSTVHQAEENARFKTMERRLYFGITTPGGVVTVLLGLGLYSLNPSYYVHSPWMWSKLAGVVALVLFHAYCGRCWWLFKHDKNPHSSTFYRWFNEIPTILLISIIAFVVFKPNFSLW